MAEHLSERTSSPSGGSLGATVVDGATEFVVASTVAERVEVCLFDSHGDERDRVDLHPASEDTWSVVIPGVGAGQHYGFRVHGPGDPANGHACDPAKLLVDPAARRITGDVRWRPELVTPGVDSASLVPRSVVVAAPHPIAADERPRTPWADTLIYEAHVGHLTARHGLVPAEARGRYLGLGAPAVVDHLQRLGVTAVELLPVQQFVSEKALVAEGARNVWGYNPLAWGAPHAGYASPGGDPVAELRRTVRTLHDAGIEVWLDVVYNHTCEGSLGSGPILSWRGFDNAATYRLIEVDGKRVDHDVTGCGNSVDTRSPMVRRLIRETLVRWVQEYGIDGFRFDLGATLIRTDGDPTPESPFLTDMAAEPDLAGVKLVAEPWDTGHGGYALGGFPVPWREWNDRFRDGARDLWRGQSIWAHGATRLAGSADVFRHHDRPATSSVNSVATHDGFTLADLVTYQEPTDGAHGQRSSNSGLEGPTDDAKVLALRARRQRAMLGTVLVAQGVPMIASGDELGRSQGGRANGYTLEPEEWGLPWPEADWDLAAWTARAASFRRAHPVLRWGAWVDEHSPAVRWFDPTGEPMDEDDWTTAERRGLQVLLDGSLIHDDRLLVLFLAGEESRTFQLPAGRWRVHLDAAERRGVGSDQRIRSGEIELAGPAFVALVGVPDPDA